MLKELKMKNSALIKQFKSHPTYGRFVGLMAPHNDSPEQAVCSIYAAVMGSIDGLVPGGKYTAEDLCGPEIWEAWPTDGLHRAMGICLSFLVAAELVPLVCLSPAHRRNKRYSLKPQKN
jgi:hypothetical protein